MREKLLLILGCALLFACHKNNNQSGCGVQVCSDIFKQINVVFTDKAGQRIYVTQFSALNQRTNLPLVTKVNLGIPVAMTYSYLVADDSMRDQLSTGGDNVLVTATNSTTGQIKSTLFNISGGCNCHVQKLSGPDTVKFDQ